MDDEIRIMIRGDIEGIQIGEEGTFKKDDINKTI